MTGLRALVFLEAARTGAGEQLQNKRAKFVEGGGLLIAPERMIATAAPREPRHGYSVWSHGKGSVYVPEKPWTDPWQLTADVHLLAGRDLDVLRLYNAASVNIAYTQSQDGAHGIVQIVHYSMRAPATGITVALRKKWKRARLLRLETPNGTPLTVETSCYGVEFPLPAFPVMLQSSWRLNRDVSPPNPSNFSRLSSGVAGRHGPEYRRCSDFAGGRLSLPHLWSATAPSAGADDGPARRTRKAGGRQDGRDKDQSHRSAFV